MGARALHERLLPSEKSAIEDAHKAGTSARALAHRYRVSRTAVDNIIRNHNAARDNPDNPPKAQQETQRRRSLPTPRPCQHCGRMAQFPRGLCWKCYYDPAIRPRYASSRPTGRGHGVGVKNAPLPQWPTVAQPGTEAKILAMIERACRREQLFHPDDARG